MEAITMVDVMFTNLRRSLFGLLLVLWALAPFGARSAAAQIADAEARRLLAAAAPTICEAGLDDVIALEAALSEASPGLTLANVADSGETRTWIRRRVRLEDREAGLALIVVASRAGDALRRVTLEIHDIARGAPVMTALADGGCSIFHGRAIRYDDAGMARELLHFAADLETVESREHLNPPLPPGEDPGGVTIAHVDSGVNYLLPEIAPRLARDGAGESLGYDYWDLDARPFDGDSARSPFFPIRHGTPVASLLVKEAPESRIIPYRYPRPDMTRMADLIAAAAAGGATIVAMPLGSTRREDWTAFEAAAAAHPELLFVVSAGNDGRDLDDRPLYPASLPLENMIVVTSADAFGRLASGSNWGAVSVDLMVPAEKLEVIDFRGARGITSGSSYAVPRVAALAARLKAANPAWTIVELKRALFERAAPPLERGPPRVAVGWIPNPADDG